MRGSRSVLLIAWLCLGWTVPAAQAASLEIRPFVTPEEYAKLDERERQRRVPLEPRHVAAFTKRAERWRSFDDDITAPGFNRSPHARTRRGAPAPERALPESVRPRTPHGLPVQTKRVAFLRIDFLNDRDGSRSSGDGGFDLSPPDSTVPAVDRPPRNRTFYLAQFEALSRYYEAQSYGLVRIEGDVWPREQDRAYSLSDMADFGPWRFSRDIYPAAVHLFRSAILAADSQSIALGDRVPWSDYDRFVLIHSGSDLQSDVSQDSPLDIPSFTLGVDDSDAVIFPDSSNVDFPIDRVAIVPETGSQDGYYGAVNGVIAHECGHLLFGMHDVYDINSGLPVVGFWSLMDYGNGAGSVILTPTGEEVFATGFLPTSLDPWHRFRFLLNDRLLVPEIPYGDTTGVHYISKYPDLWRVTQSSDEYLLLENRWRSPGDSILVDQDDSSRVVLGPKIPWDYDALAPGYGMLAWHVDESVLPFEFTFPIDTSYRVNPDFGLNSNPSRRGLSIIEADGLADLGDPGSPFLLGVKYDPYFLSNNSSLSDTTKPNLIPHIGTRPHTRLDFLSDPDSIMPTSAARVWQLAGWPVVGDFPLEGPQLLAVDADGTGDRKLEVCWAGGADSFFINVPDLGPVKVPNPDSAALFAVRLDGTPINGLDQAIARLDRRPRQPLAAVSIGEDIGGGQPPHGPSFFAVSTYGDSLSRPGGRVWLIDGRPGTLGQPLPGWPPALPAVVTTPPVVAGSVVYVGCADGRVYAIGLDGVVLGATNPPLPGGVVGRLAVTEGPSVLPAPEGIAIGSSSSPAGGTLYHLIAAGGPNGDVAIYNSLSYAASSGWPRRIGFSGFDPEFLWINFGGAEGGVSDCQRGGLSLVVHHADWLWAFCQDNGQQLPGWGRDIGDTLVYGLGAGDPDGDGFPEVLTQSENSEVAFWNLSGHPSPGWPRKGTTEEFPQVFDDDGALIVDRRLTQSPPLAADLDGDLATDIIALNASGIVAALSNKRTSPPGWPLSSGLGATGAPMAADLDRDGNLELVVPDRFGVLYGYSIPLPSTIRRAIDWRMLGGNPGRTASLEIDPVLNPATPGPTPGPLVRGSLMAYPNPARRRPVSFAYQLSEPADVEFRILDTSGHEVASFSRRGRQSDNLEVWDPGGLPAGLYMARLRFRGGGSERTEVVPIGVIR